MYIHDTDSYLNSLQIENKSTDGVNFSSDVCIYGELYNTETPITNSYNIKMRDGASFADGKWNYNIRLQGKMTLSKDLLIDKEVIVESDASINLNGYSLNVDSMLFFNGTININGGKFIVNKDLRLQGRSTSSDGTVTYKDASNAYLKMNNPLDYVKVCGNFVTQSGASSSSYLTNGTLEVRGDLIQKNGSKNNFVTSGKHIVMMSGEAKQKISFESSECKIENLEINNREGVVLSEKVAVGAINPNGNPYIYENGARVGWTLSENETIEGDLVLGAGTLDLSGNELKITGNLIQAGGTVNVNGGKLIVDGAYKLQTTKGEASTGILKMTNEADKVIVGGDFINQSNQNHLGSLTAGTLSVAGDFKIYNYSSSPYYSSYYNFRPTGTHTVILNGEKKQNVYIHDTDSYLNSLQITNNSTDGVTINSGVNVYGNLYNTDTPVANSSNIYMRKSAIFADDKWNYDIYFVDNFVLPKNIDIMGNAYFSTTGTLDLNSCTLNINGNFKAYYGLININKGTLNVKKDLILTSGTYSSAPSSEVAMTNEKDKIIVGGNLLVSSRSYSSDSEYTAGTIELKGNLTQTGNYRNFITSSNHKILMSGETEQKISFENSQCKIANLEITNKAGVVLSEKVGVGYIEAKNNPCIFENGARLGWTLEGTDPIDPIEGDLVLGAGTLDLAGHELTIKGNLIQAGGIVNVNNGKLIVEGSYKIQTTKGESSTGILVMKNEKDEVIVGGDFINQSNQDCLDSLTAGTLSVAGDFKIYNNPNNPYYSSYNNFKPTGTHTVILNGTKKQNVYINHTNSYLNSLQIANKSTDGVNFSSDVCIYGELYNKETPITNTF